MAAPVKQTCPDIDKVINAIDKAKNISNGARYDNNLDSDVRDMFYDVYWELDGLEKELEKLRSANSSLREWGEELEAENKNLKSEIQSYEI